MIEYKVLTNTDTDYLARDINAAAAMGWMVSFYSSSGNGVSYRITYSAMMEREKSD